MSNYPPGVTGNEPQITGEWPCRICGGAGYDDENEDGKHTCTWCKGTGIEPEEVDVDQIRYLVDYHDLYMAREYVCRMSWEWLDRHDPETRKFLRECIDLVRVPHATDNEINRSFDAYR